jgi:hypothetical protein
MLDGKRGQVGVRGAFAALLFVAGPSLQAAALNLEVDAGATDRVETPVCAEIALPAFAAARPDIMVTHCQSNVLGLKYEHGCHAGSADLAAKWDDDDWYGPRRLERKVEPIVSGDADIVSFREEYALLIPNGTWWKPLHNHRHSYHDGTLVFKKSLLSKVQFGRCSLGESAIFVRKAVRVGAKHVTLPAASEFVYVRHSTNAWRFPIEKHFQPGGSKPMWFPKADLDAMVRMTQNAPVDSRLPA